ncbi:MAG: DUF3365 domain-containing protein [Rhodospirillales bacterium]|nr:DUF3365 domain-containing protein [Rhodospirillales bacterium]MBO6786100.1 DUF3365 domain-containing protein [Rhodospirillales bacterium]
MRALFALLMTSLIVTAPLPHARAAEMDDYVAEAETVLQRLRGEMMQEMVNAQQKGPAAAIDVCRHLAPEINAKIEQETGWTLRRTGLRVRNPANAPIDDEEALMRSFELKAMAGQPPQLLRTARIIERDGEKVFHLIQAVPMFDTCLGCHGSDIDPATLTRIKELYPDDNATGYAVGDIRGAFSLYKPVDAFATSRPAGPVTLASLGYKPTRDPAAKGDATVGEGLYKRYCENCHAPADLARHVFPDPEKKPDAEVCKFLGTHGMTKGQQDCDVTAYLKDIARFLEAHGN